MMDIQLMALGDIINLRGLFLAIPLVVFALLLGWFFRRRKWKARQKPGQFLRYAVPDKNASACRGVLGNHSDNDLFRYKMEGAASGGWYIHFTLHNPTQQQLDTLFLLQFEDDDPAVFSLRFLREAFGMREPVIGEGLLDDFFAQKLGAQHLPNEDAEDSAEG